MRNIILKLLLFIVLPFILLITFFTLKTFLFSFFLFIPTIAAIVIDRSSDRCLSLTVGLCNISGMILFLPSILVQAMHNNIDYIMYSMIKNIMTIYGFSAMGLSLYLFAPRIIALSYLARVSITHARLKRKMNKLLKSWDL